MGAGWPETAAVLACSPGLRMTLCEADQPVLLAFLENWGGHQELTLRFEVVTSFSFPTQRGRAESKQKAFKFRPGAAVDSTLQDGCRLDLRLSEQFCTVCPLE